MHQINQSAAKWNGPDADRHSQLYIVEGCRVKVRFLPDASSSIPLAQIQKSLLSAFTAK